MGTERTTAEEAGSIPFPAQDSSGLNLACEIIQAATLEASRIRQDAANAGERIYEEMVKAARSQADQIIAEARREAGQIRAEAAGWVEGKRQNRVDASSIPDVSLDAIKRDLSAMLYQLLGEVRRTSAAPETAEPERQTPGSPVPPHSDLKGPPEVHNVDPVSGPPSSVASNRPLNGHSLADNRLPRGNGRWAPPGWISED